MKGCEGLERRVRTEMDTEVGDAERPEVNCRERLTQILSMQRETRDCLSDVVGPPVHDQNGKDEEEPVGALATVECGLRAVERHAALLLEMVTDLHDRL